MALGRGNGITGTLIDLPGSSPGAQVYAQILSSSSHVLTESMSTAGPGDGGANTAILGDYGVTGTANGFVKLSTAGWPYPYALALASGTIVETITEGVTAQYNAILTDLQFERSPDNKDHKTSVSYNFHSNGPISVTGFSTTPVSPASGTTFKVVNANTSISLDKSTLEDASAWQEVYVGVADTAAAEKTATAARLSGIATDPRFSLLKVNVATARRWSSNILIVNYTASRTNSQDRLLNPKRQNKLDPQLIADYVAIPVRWDPTLGSPTPPSIPANMKLLDTADDVIDDHASVRAYIYARNDHADEMLNPHITAHVDISDLETTQTKASLFTTGTPPSDPGAPAGLYLVFRDDVVVTAAGTSNLSMRVWIYRKMTTQMAAELGETDYFLDPQHLTDHQRIAKMDATPAILSGLVLRGTDHKYLTSGHILNIAEAGTRSTRDDIVFPKSFLKKDPSDLRTEGMDTHVYDSNGTVPLPTNYAASAVVVIASAIFKETSGSSTHLSRVEYTLGKQSTKSEEEVARTFVSVDPNGIQTRANVAAMDNPTPALPSGLGLVSRTIHQQPTIKGQHTLYINEGGLRDTIGDLVFPETVSKRSSMTAFVDEIATVIGDNTNDVATIADNEFAVFQGNAYGIDLSVERINNNQVRMVRTYRNPGIEVISRMEPNPRLIYAKLDTDGVVKAYVAQVRQRGSGSYWASVTPKWSRNYVRYITVNRIMAPGTTFPEFSGVFWNTNADSFLGLSPGTVLYVGYEGITNIGLSGNRPFSVAYQFINDPNGIFDLDGWRSEIYSTSSLTTGYTDVAALGMEATIPPQGDLSGMVS